MLFRQLNQAATTSFAQGFPARVAKRRHQVNGFHTRGFQQIGQLFHQHAVIVGIHAENIGLRQLEDLQRRQIGRTLNDNRITRIEQGAGDDIQRLLRTGSDIDMTCRTGHAARLTQFANGLTQRRITFGQTVLERIVKAPVHHLLHRQVQAFGIKKLRGRNAAAQGDHAGQFTVLEEFADGGGLKFTRAGGESPIVHTIFLFCLVVVMFYLFFTDNSPGRTMLTGATGSYVR